MYYLRNITCNKEKFNLSYFSHQSTSHSKNAQKAHPLVKEDVLFITYVIPFRAILPSMESRVVDSHKKI